MEIGDALLELESIENKMMHAEHSTQAVDGKIRAIAHSVKVLAWHIEELLKRQAGQEAQPQTLLCQKVANDD